MKCCSFIKEENGQYYLKEKHAYYGQVQLGLSMLNFKKCFLILYASFDESLLIIEVRFSYEFSKKMLEKIKQNYFSKMLHVICSEGKI